MQMPSSYQTVYVSDLTSSGGGNGQGVSLQQYSPISPAQAYVLPQAEMTSASGQVGITVPATQTGQVQQQQQTGTIQAQQTQIPASSVSMMFNLA